MNLSEKVRMLFWITSLVKRRGPISLRDINEEWVNNELSENRRFDRNTFKNYLYNIEVIFGIEIIYKNGGYCIADKAKISTNNLHDLLISHIQNIEFYSKFSDLGDKLQVDDIPEGSQYLDIIGQALKENRLLCIEYQKFIDENSKVIVIEPYCLKLKDRRWYLLAKNKATAEVRTYALDRISSLIIEGNHFTPDSTIDVSSYYSNCIGVYADDEKLDDVVLKTTEWQAHYLRTLPLHKSQQEITPCVFKYHVDITPDLINEILRMGSKVEVQKPNTMREEMKRVIEEMKNRYEC